MDSLRNNIEINVLLNDLYIGVLDICLFNLSNSGNIYNFIDQKYKSFAERMKNIIFGSNGGMANVGKGEWLISLCTGIDPESEKPRVSIIKGLGDLQYIMVKI